MKIYFKCLFIQSDEVSTDIVLIRLQKAPTAAIFSGEWVWGRQNKTHLLQLSP